jgi:hypothetical protein
MSDIINISFDEAKTVKVTGVDKFTQNKHAQQSLVSIISFRPFHEKIINKKANEKGSTLTSEEKADIILNVDKQIAKQLNKEVTALTEVDRLDIKSPKFGVAFTHFNEIVGTIRCLSEYEGSVLTKAELCCQKFGDADQKVATVIMTYPVTDDGQVDYDLLKAKKYTNFYIWQLAAKKFKKITDVYNDARRDKADVIDLRVILDGDPKFQKQEIKRASTAFWATEECAPEIRQWILEQGLRSYKYVAQNLGFEMTKDKLIEKLATGSSSAPNQVKSGESHPVLVQSYEDYIS